MTDSQGTPVWYELLTSQFDAVRPFYQAVMGWNVASHGDPGLTGMDYRMVERGGGKFAGGIMEVSPEMKGRGVRPCWLIYFGVDDVDASVAKAEQLGAKVHMPAATMDGVGRMAMLMDPQGAPFYLMRGASDQDSDVFSGMEPGGCRWNELTSTDAPAAIEFYRELLGYGTDNFMPMGDAGKYTFIELGGSAIGAIGPQTQPDMPAMWLPYFGVTDIDQARSAAEGAGGMVMMGPIEVPGGDWIIIGADPAGAPVGFVGPKKS